MRKGGRATVETVGLVVMALSAQAMIHGLLDQDSELLWGIFDWIPGGLTGRLVFFGLIALVAMMFAAWAHTRREPDAERAGDPREVRGRETA